MRPVVMEGQRVSLAVLVREDLPVVWRWYNDRRVRAYLSRPYDVLFYEDEVEWYERIRRERERHRIFAVVTREQKRLVGVVGLHDIEPTNRTAEIGYFIGPEYWNRGYGTEAVSLAVEYAFTWLNLRKLFARVYEPNRPSIAILESNGFLRAGRLRRHQYVPGEGFVDVLLYERFRDGEDAV